MGFPDGLVVKNPPANARDWSSVPESGRPPGKGNFPVFLPGKFHGQRSLAGYSSWSCKRVRHDLEIKQQYISYPNLIHL